MSNLPLKIMKFGGIGLQDAAAMRHAARIIRDEPGRKVVVASALRGVTDAIHSNLDALAHDEARAHILISELRKVHRRTAEGLRTNDSRESATYAIDKTLDHLERLLFGVTYTEELTPRTQDLALSFGERLSVRLLSAYLAEEGLRSHAYDADRLGLVTNDQFGWASPDLAATERNLKDRLMPHLDDGLVPVVTGFFGANRKGQTTILGRGGTDFSAAIIANALDANLLEIWKETTGFLTADPRVVPKARRITEMGYEEAAELANFGAKILHPRTVEPVAHKGIPIRIRELKDPAAPGTLIRDLAGAPSCFIRSIATRKNLAIVNVRGPGLGYTPGLGAQIFTLLGREALNVVTLAASEAGLALLLDAPDAKRAIQLLTPLRGGIVQDVQLSERMSLVAVVGKGLGEQVGSGAKILDAVSRANINIALLSVGGSEFAFNFVVRESDAETALRAIHERFLEEGNSL